MSLKTLLVVGCIFSACARPPAHVRCVDEVTGGFGQIVKSQEELVCLGRGGYYGNKCVNGLYIDFERSKAATRDEAKELLMKTVGEFLKFVNQNDKLRLFLKKHPITVNDISLSIAFVDAHHRPLPSLSQIHLYDGKIVYSNYEPSKKAYVAFSQETYPE